MAIKLIIFCSLFALALGFTVPEDEYYSPDTYYEPTPVDQSQLEEGDVLARVARSYRNDEDQYNSPDIYYEPTFVDQSQLEEGNVLLRVARSLQDEEDQYNNPDIYYEPTFVDQSQLEEGDVLVRVVRSPQGSFGANVGHDSRHGTSAGLEYNRQLSKNLEAYVNAQRNFKYNDNSGQAGLRYRF